MCVVETMSLVGYKIVYIVNFVPNPDWHLDSKWRSRNRDGGRVFKKLVQSRGDRTGAATTMSCFTATELRGE